MQMRLRSINKINNQYNSTCHPERSVAEPKDLAQRANTEVCCEVYQYESLDNYIDVAHIKTELPDASRDPSTALRMTRSGVLG